MEKLGMVNISKKTNTERIAKAHAFIKLGKEIMEKIRNNNIPKGDVLETARIAGILAAKNTSGLIPLCHNIELEYANVEYVFKDGGILIQSIVQSIAKTGIEMEALLACSISALTIYDMCKMFSKSIEITDLYLVEKKGGKSGTYRRKSG